MTNRCSALIIGNFLSETVGVRGVCEDLANQLTTSGWHVVTASASPHPIRRALSMIATAVRDRRRYRVAQVDVYSGRAFLWAEAVSFALKALGKPYILTLHGGRLPELAQHRPRRVARLLRNATAVTVPSGYLFDAMRSFRQDLILIPNPIDLQRYRFVRRDNPAPKLLWIRSFHKTYNPTLAPRVLALLRTKHSDAKLTMIGPDKGDGSFQEVLKAAGELGVTEYIVLPGAVPKASVPDWLQKGDIFLNTTFFDNTPVSVLEAMACGLCVVSTKVGGTKYLIANGETGFLVPIDDAPAAAAAIHRLLTEQGLASRLSHQARKKVEPLSWQNILPCWQRLLTNCADGQYSEKWVENTKTQVTSSKSSNENLTLR